jgi:hypothetical protein
LKNGLRQDFWWGTHDKTQVLDNKDENVKE